MLKLKELHSTNQTDLQKELCTWIDLLTNFIKRREKSLVVLSSMIHLLHIIHTNFHELNEDSIWEYLVSVLSAFLDHLRRNQLGLEYSSIIGKSQIEICIAEFILKLKIFLESSFPAYSLTEWLPLDSLWHYDIRDKFLAVLLFLLLDDQFKYCEEDEELFETFQRFSGLNPCRRTQLKENILKCDSICYELVEILWHLSVDNVDRLLEVASFLPKFLHCILRKASSLRSFLNLSTTAKNNGNFHLSFLCRLAYNEVSNFYCFVCIKLINCFSVHKSLNIRNCYKTRSILTHQCLAIPIFFVL